MEPLEPGPPPADVPHLFFKRGKKYPRAIAWLGFSSFWGHLWHLAASVVATEDIDARDWMAADDPDDLTARIGRLLGGGEGATLCERLDGELWIDFIADVGDDRDVVGAVADMLLREYRLPGADVDDGDIVAPRGHILLFGGDTAYPVATDIEIHNRVCLPFNEVLRERGDDRPRVLLGVPGNHDWYDGLDGFARMFRARRGSVDRSSMVPDPVVDKSGPVGHLLDWVEAFRVGRYVTKRSVLPLIGYTPMQNASYFCLRLAPDLDLWAIDRQLRGVDFTQQSFFMEQRSRAQDRALLLAVSDPVYAHLEPNPVGRHILESLELDLEHDDIALVTGDTHHYCRQRFGSSLHVIAGGGGAFLHPARIARAGFEPPEAEFPGPRASTALALQVPWQIAGGRAGFVVHTVVALMYLPLMGLQLMGQELPSRSAVTAYVLVAVATTVACGMIGGWRQGRPLAIGTLAALTGLWVGAVPFAVHELVTWAAAGRLGGGWQAVASWLLAIYPATLGFGTFLMVLTLLGLEQHQAFSALAHPGYKHFMRLRVRRDGSAIDGWVLGKVDTLDQDEDIVLVDRYTWHNPRHQAPPRAEAEDA